MAISDQHIRLMQSEVLTDANEGGGRITGNEVVSGLSNNLFPDVSELDRTIGRVSLRKAYVQVLTNNTDVFYGNNVIIDKPPTDPLVSVALFKTDSWSDRRTNAASRIESYLARGAKIDGYLWEQHIAGQRTLLVLQRQDRPLPSVGSTLVVVKNPGLGTEQSQYVRITSVSSEVLEFTRDTTTFKRAVVTLNISDPLAFDVLGGVPDYDDVRGAGTASRVYNTLVADAAKYYGIKPLAQSAALGAFSVKASGIFTQLVPSAQSEAAISDAKPNNDAGVYIAAADGAVSFSTNLSFNVTSKLYVGQSIYPGSFSMALGTDTITETGDGLLKIGETQIGLIDYGNGILTATSGSYSGTKAISFKPAAVPSIALHSGAVNITAENRSSTFSFILDPVPASGTASVHFMAQGKWYVLRDNGAGLLKGDDSATGAGAVNYTTGSLVVTLGALPDVGSSVLFMWGIATQETVLPETNALKVYSLLTLAPPAGKNIQRNSITISWLEGVTTKTATDSNGNLTGDATGKVDYVNNTVQFTPNNLIPPNTQLEVSFNHGNRTVDSFASPAKDGNGKLNLLASNGSMIAGSVRVTWSTENDLTPIGVVPTVDQIGGANPASVLQTAVDNGSGALLLNGITNIGTVNYATGAVQFNPDTVSLLRKPVFKTLPPALAFN